jgi:arylsulfatase A-like enzyme
VHEAFDLEREAPDQRERYGRNRHGQSVLLARRLVEAGSRFVTVYWGKELQDWADGKGERLANNPWDTHRNHFPLTRDELVPRADRALAALLEDLSERGMLEETLVVWMGEFGRSPKISEWASREHWPYANTILMAGAGLPGGAVYGKTDGWAAEVTENPVSPADVIATIFQLLGLDPRASIHDAGGRPYPLSEGEPIRALL